MRCEADICMQGYTCDYVYVCTNVVAIMCMCVFVTKVCMYVCMYVCVYVCICVCMLRMDGWMDVAIVWCVCVCVFLYVCVRMYVCLCDANVCMYACMYVCVMQMHVCV